MPWVSVTKLRKFYLPFPSMKCKTDPLQQMTLKWALILCHREIGPPPVIDHLTVVGLADLETGAVTKFFEFYLEILNPT